MGNYRLMLKSVDCLILIRTLTCATKIKIHGLSASLKHVRNWPPLWKSEKKCVDKAMEATENKLKTKPVNKGTVDV